MIKKTIVHVPSSLVCGVLAPNLTIPYYHMVSDGAETHTKNLYPHKGTKQFVDDIDFLGRRYTPIDMPTLLGFVRNGRALPRHALLLTFDDGFRQMHDVVAPILLKKGMPAVFFVNSGFTDNRNLCYQHKASILAEHILNGNISPATEREIAERLQASDCLPLTVADRILSIGYSEGSLLDEIGRLLEVDFDTYLLENKPYLTSEQIMKLVLDGFGVGGHSIDHPLYSNLSVPQQLRQTIESVSFVKKAFRLDYGLFAFPHSDSGVTKEYYEELFKQTVVDVHFGTAGMAHDLALNRLQRFSLEKPVLPAKDILAWQSARRIWKSLLPNETS